jgi:hypothetical protein
MSKLLPTMREFGRDYMQELADEQPDLVDLLILTVHLPTQKKKEILIQLTDKIKDCYIMQQSYTP